MNKEIEDILCGYENVLMICNYLESYICNELDRLDGEKLNSKDVIDRVWKYKEMIEDSYFKEMCILDRKFKLELLDDILDSLPFCNTKEECIAIVSEYKNQYEKELVE